MGISCPPVRCNAVLGGDERLLALARALRRYFEKLDNDLRSRAEKVLCGLSMLMLLSPACTSVFHNEGSAETELGPLSELDP